MIADQESADLATRVIDEICTKQRIRRQQVLEGAYAARDRNGSLKDLRLSRRYTTGRLD
jgi:hypothetical protein